MDPHFHSFPSPPTRCRGRKQGARNIDPKTLTAEKAAKREARNAKKCDRYGTFSASRRPEAHNASSEAGLNGVRLSDHPGIADLPPSPCASTTYTPPSDVSSAHPDVQQHPNHNRSSSPDASQSVVEHASIPSPPTSSKRKASTSVHSSLTRRARLTPPLPAYPRSPASRSAAHAELFQPTFAAETHVRALFTRVVVSPDTQTTSHDISDVSARMIPIQTSGPRAAAFPTS
ncbi:hypothetical protein EIP91_004360 [Steccherinum ochraceum]|uniref:Uncharacterized protein n=1 Tax=Steccherinum ochraceum TaxID=92696 RepID=A0A4R0RF39_9APHY|nr:hypothetical protein EIP91_004360 [Steccherinum ochraceum]